jgi:hypothetical protein
MSGSEPSLVFAGSFVQAIIRARDLGTPLVQAVNGKEMYGSWMIYPKGQDPAAILRDSPAEIAFAVGASSGESGAKAATGGKAAVAAPNHGAAVGAVKAGKARAAFVKSWWWESNSAKYPELEAHQVPGVSASGNPDNILTAGKSVPAEVQQKLAAAALGAKEGFAASEMTRFDAARLDFSLGLMKQGGIDPASYAWR